MAHTERIELALAALREAAEALVHAVGVEGVTTARQDFVSVGLVSDVPDDLVLRGVEDVMEGDRQLHHAQAGAEVASLFADHIHNELAQLVAHLGKILHSAFAAQVGGLGDFREEGAGGVRLVGHGGTR